MLRFLGKTTASMARSGGSSPSEVCVAVDDGLSAWELVNASQSDDEDLYSYDSDDVTSDGEGEGVTSDADGIISDADGIINDEPEPNPAEGEDGDDDEIISIQALSVSPPMTFPVEMTRNVRHDYEEKYDDDAELHDVDDDGDDDDDDMYDDDVDDELMPWTLKDRFGKQRIKKMGKRGGPKLNKSKKLPYYDNRPGFLYGKFRGRC